MTVDTKTRIIRAVGSLKAWAQATGQTPENVSRVVNGKQPEPEWWDAVLELLEIIPRGQLPKRWWADKKVAAMKLWLISQTENTNYDTYDSAVVAAETEEEAKALHPSGQSYDWGKDFGSWGSWAESPDSVTVIELGEANASVKPGVVLASFNAG